MKINNVDMKSIMATVQAFRDDPAKAKKINTVNGDWNPAEGTQFSATVTFEHGKMTLEADQPTMMGGGGTQPGPMVYCLYGSASCFAATYATTAAEKGVVLKKLRITVESFMDFSKVFGVTDNPITEKVRYTIDVDSDADEETLLEIMDLSRSRCPAAYCLTHPIPLETELRKG